MLSCSAQQRQQGLKPQEFAPLLPGISSQGRSWGAWTATLGVSAPLPCEKARRYGHPCAGQQHRAHHNIGCKHRLPSQELLSCGEDGFVHRWVPQFLPNTEGKRSRRGRIQRDWERMEEEEQGDENMEGEEEEEEAQRGAGVRNGAESDQLLRSLFGDDFEDDL